LSWAGVRAQAVEAAVTRGLDLVVCDTSGRLHTNLGLMEELAKCRRALGKRLPGAPHQALLVLDGTTGALHAVCAPDGVPFAGAVDGATALRPGHKL
jgi:signal recognition particle GTPase